MEESSVTVIYQYGDEFLLISRMDKAIAELKKLNEMMDRQQKRPPYIPPAVVTRRVIHERQAPKRPAPALIFPFTLIAALLEKALKAFDRLIHQFVTRTIPWLVGHLYRFLHPKQPSEDLF